MSVIETYRLVQFQSEARNLFGKAGGAGRLRSGDDLAIATTVDRVTIGQGSSEAITYSGGLHQDAVESPYELLRSRLVTLLQEQNAAVQIASGSSEIDISSLTPEEAQVLVAEDGYFGIEQTSERIFQFAVGLAGNDSSRLEEILRGIEDGFADAEQAWGGKLPEISYQTQEAIMNKIDHWLEGGRNGLIGDLMDNGYVLAIDQGTTGSTVLVFNQAGAVCGRASAEITQYYPQPGWVEHDPKELWSVTLDVVKAALDQAKAEPGEVRAIGITNQRETSLLWDRHSGLPVARAVVWQDRRTAHLCDKLKQEGLEPLWQQKTGLLIDPYFSATKVHWLLEHVPELRSKAVAGEIAFGTVDSWLVWNLTGGRCHATDYSNASRTLLFNIHELDWDDDILARLDIPRAMLPTVKPSSYFYGETDPETFFGHRVPIAGIAGDQQAALFGQACYHPGMAKTTYGTGSFLLMNTGCKPVASRQRLLTTIAWGIGDEPVEYALEGSIFITGAALQWLRDGLGLISNAAESEELAASLQGNEDVYFVPALTGLGAPHWDAYARGMIIGLTRGSTKAHLVRAALESIAYQTRDVVDAMSRESGIDLQELRADGGAVANRFLMQFQADVLGVPVEIPSITETTAQGAAYLAGLAVGFWSSREELAAQWQVARRYEPVMKESQRQQLYGRWQQAVGRATGWTEESSG